MATDWVDLKLNGSGGPQKRAELEAKHFIPQQIKRLEVYVCTILKTDAFFRPGTHVVERECKAADELHLESHQLS